MHSLVVVSAVVLLIFSSCAKSPVTGKRKFIVTSTAQENDLGDKAYDDILKKEKVDTTSELARQVKAIGERMAKVANRPDFKWEFNVFESEQINAFCLPGGKVGFYSGMQKVADTEGRIAAVIGHEVAHALARHGGERMSMQIGQQLLMGIVAVAAFSDLPPEKRNLALAALGVGATVGVILPFSRDNESEADEIGLTLMAKAGYDPREAVVLWQRMEKMAGGGGGPAFLSTHPSSKKRQEELTKLMPGALKIYQESLR